MRESEYIRTVHRLLPLSVYHLKLNLPYTAGIADCWYSGSRADLWAEWKYLPLIPATLDLMSGKQPMLSRLQDDWLACRHKEGRAVCVMVGATNGVVILPPLTWREPLTREDFLRQMQPKSVVANWITQHCTGHYGTAEVSPVAEPMPLVSSPSDS